jgi:hypothetical protein
VNVLDAQASAAAVGPIRAAQWRQYPRGLNIADALQILQQLTLFSGQLSGSGQVLQRAPPANAEMRAARDHPIRRSGQNVDQARLVHLPAPLDHSKAHPFPRQRTLDEYRLAVHPRDPAAIMRKIDDVGLLNRA